MDPNLKNRVPQQQCVGEMISGEEFLENKKRKYILCCIG
jgi:hypothetical protein